MSPVGLVLVVKVTLGPCAVNEVTLAVQADLLLVPGVLDPTYCPV
jgi:hypothetical protein